VIKKWPHWSSSYRITWRIAQVVFMWCQSRHAPSEYRAHTSKAFYRCPSEMLMFLLSVSLPQRWLLFCCAFSTFI
jgi:hypothetical protein